MNRFIVKLVHGFSRLAFWRKPAASNPELPDPETTRHSEPVEAESSPAADASEPQGNWLARLKQAVQRMRKPAQETPAAPEQIAAEERPAKKNIDASATADDMAAPKPSWLARLKSALRRQPRGEQLEADEDTSNPRTEKSRRTTASSTAAPDGEEDAIPVSRIRRVLGVLSNKWVWIPGISVMLIAIIATMLFMLVQSGQEKKQLQTELVAAQKKLKQASTTKKVAVHPGAPKQAGHPAVATVGDTTAESDAGGDSGDCDVSSKENVSQNLKNCIDSFNAMAN